MSTRWMLWGAALALFACEDADSELVPEASIDARALDADPSDAWQPDAGCECDIAFEDAAPGPDAAEPDAAAPDAGVRSIYTPCSDESRVGRFEVALADGYTSVQGQVANGVVPSQVSVITAQSGPCTLVQPPVLFCEAGCEVGQVCTAQGTCAPAPANVGVGEVAVDGLTAPVTMTAGEPVWFYSFRGDLPHPGFAPGDPVTLTAAGADTVQPFTLNGVGIEPLVWAGDTVALTAGTPLELRWTSAEGPARLRVEINIANHGGTPAHIWCDLDDTGTFDVPVALTDALLALGFSGFPSVVATRRTVDAAQTALGCVEFALTSTHIIDIEIDGLISCSFDEDCPDGRLCQPDLTCEPAEDAP
jgi:hypothetical protein